MLDAACALGADVAIDEGGQAAQITGSALIGLSREVRVDARQSGTTSRFVLPALALLPVGGLLDGADQLRARPFGPLINALRDLGAAVEERGAPGCLPVAVRGPVRGGHVELPGHVTSQFLSGMLMAAVLMPEGLQVRLTSTPVSEPYLRMTASVMAHFGVEARIGDRSASVTPGAYRATDYVIEPDATAASYFLAAAAITSGQVTIRGLGAGSPQGDVAFATVLEQMGAHVDRTSDAIRLTGPGSLRGVDVDMRDISDTAQTLAAVAVFATSETRVRGIGFIRRKETDRIAAVVTELRRAGIDASEEVDGFTIRPGQPDPTTFETYHDHRMAMSLALIGLRADGIKIRNPSCVAKTYPNYFTDLSELG
jgi:3-phosphoshikimate 1-carboxyvinyltransferase